MTLFSPHLIGLFQRTRGIFRQLTNGERRTIKQTQS